MTWNKERYITDILKTFKNQSRDREGINLLKRDFLEPEITEDYEEFKEGTVPRELIESMEENTYMWQKISRNNNKK